MGTATRQGIMLACQAQEKTIAALGPKFFLQPKLNGERCRTTWPAELTVPEIVSSYCNAYNNIPHIVDEVDRFAKHFYELFDDPSIKLDGELYRHDWTWSQIRSVASRSVNAHAEAAQLQYHVFDFICENTSQMDRFEMLDEAFSTFESDVIIQVPTELVTKSTWTQRCVEICDLGYEGVILRDASAPYEATRSRNVLKFKPTEEDSYTIVEVKEALTAGTREPKGMVGAFFVETDGIRFKVSAGKMKHDERYRIWGIREQVVADKMKLLCKHELLKTVNGVPLGCVGLSLVDADYVEKPK